MSTVDHLLRILSRVGASGLTGPVLLMEHQVTVGSLGDAAFDEAVSRLKNAGLVDSETDTLTGDVSYKATVEGHRRANKHRL